MARVDYHTIAGWQSEEDYFWEYKWNKGEDEYFAHVENNTHNYPLAATGSILVDNGAIDFSEECPF